MTKKFNRYKVNASDVSDLMSYEQGYSPATEDDFQEFLKIAEKQMVDITERQVFRVNEIIRRGVQYDNHSLSSTGKKSIYQHYAYSQYKASKVSQLGEKPMSLDKGEIAEQDGIKLLSSLDGVEYTKNTELFSNPYFKGIPDILIRNENNKIIGIKDIKIPIDLPSFLERVDGDYLKDDAWEMRAYLDILKIPEGEICYCLVDLPESSRKKRLLEHKTRMEINGNDPVYIKKRLKQIERSMVYDYIPQELRIRRFSVTRKGYFTVNMHKRVKILRERLAQLHDKFINPLTLVEIPEQ